MIKKKVHMEANDEYRKNYIKNEHPSTQKQYLKAFKTKQRSIAIRIKCLDCCAFQRTEAADCNVISCPLYNFNPYRIARIKQESKHLILSQ